MNNNFLIINKIKNKVILNKPFYVGVAVLDYSKLLMYKYHNGIFKKIYKDKIRLLMTDTDSLFYEIKTDDAYKDILGKDSPYQNILIHQTLKKIVFIFLMIIKR